MDEGFFRQTRHAFAGILCVLQENATQYGGKRPIQTVFEVVNAGSKTSGAGPAHGVSRPLFSRRDGYLCARPSSRPFSKAVLFSGSSLGFFPSLCSMVSHTTSGGTTSV